METNQKALRGVAHGNIIALFDDTGLPDGEVVSVVVTKSEMTPEEKRHPELVKLFGAWAADGPELDEFVKWTYEQRKIGRPDLEP
jgi:hypothetical protein